MMTRKTYIEAARIVRDTQLARGADHADTARAAFVALFRDDNPRFDASRFNEACNPPNVKVRKSA